jgi:hypothetical protein
MCLYFFVSPHTLLLEIFTKKKCEFSVRFKFAIRSTSEIRYVESVHGPDMFDTTSKTSDVGT